MALRPGGAGVTRIAGPSRAEVIGIATPRASALGYFRRPLRGVDRYTSFSASFASPNPPFGRTPHLSITLRNSRQSWRLSLPV